MKTISLYTNNGSWLTQLHPFTKLWYLAAAICIPLLTGSLWGFAVMIIISFVLLKSGRLIKKALPLIAEKLAPHHVELFYNYSYNFSDSWSGQSTEQECTVCHRISQVL